MNYNVRPNSPPYTLVSPCFSHLNMWSVFSLNSSAQISSLIEDRLIPISLKLGSKQFCLICTKLKCLSAIWRFSMLFSPSIRIQQFCQQLLTIKVLMFGQSRRRRDLTEVIFSNRSFQQPEISTLKLNDPVNSKCFRFAAFSTLIGCISSDTYLSRSRCPFRK